jgi:hypothetical protein
MDDAAKVRQILEKVDVVRASQVQPGDTKFALD